MDRICKDGRIWGQNNKEAGTHLGVRLELYVAPPYIKKGWNPKSVGKPFRKGHQPTEASKENRRITIRRKIAAGEMHGPTWKGGVVINKAGYRMIWDPDHPDANGCGYVFEHRVVAAKMLGRLLLKNEIVHHKNENRQDNQPENLVVLQSTADHMKIHREIRRNYEREKWQQRNHITNCPKSSAIDKYDRHENQAVFAW